MQPITQIPGVLADFLLGKVPDFHHFAAYLHSVFRSPKRDSNAYKTPKSTKYF